MSLNLIVLRQMRIPVKIQIFMKHLINWLCANKNECYCYLQDFSISNIDSNFLPDLPDTSVEAENAKTDLQSNFFNRHLSQKNFISG